MKKKKKRDKINFGNILYMLKEVAAVSKLQFALIFTSMGINVVSSLVSMFFLKYIIDGLSEKREFSYFVTVVAVRLGVFVVSQVYSVFVSYYQQIIQLKMSFRFSMNLYNSVKNIDLASAENAEFYDKYQRALSQGSGRAQMLLSMLGSIVSSFAMGGSLVAILVTSDPVLILISAAVALIQVGFNLVTTKLNFNFNMALTRTIRGFDYIQRVFYQPPYAKDIRRTRLSELMRDKFKKRMGDYIDLMKKNYLPLQYISSSSSLLQTLVLQGAAPLYLVYKVVRGAVSIGDYTLLTSAVSSTFAYISNFANMLPQVVENSLFIQNYIDIVTFKSGLVSSGAELEVDAAVVKEIRLNDVSFAYSGGAEVLRGVNLTVAPGERVAIVGENGAGKTTLVKLIMGLYDPTAGSLTINGVPYRDINRDSLYRSMSVVEQDFQCYALTIRENVALATRDGTIDNARVDAILERVLLKEKIDSLPNGADTEYTKEFDENGVEFSGGQLQRLAIARALYNESGLLIMDEPSSALDPLSEQRIYDLINSISDGKTLILISHRLSCVKDMDRIIVMDEGQIIEQGNHVTLMQLSGKYAEMFTVQAERYSDSV
ncbi:MAG: ABC transporter ATP-binding protein/permease [Oscillospiraceae bacterium]|nr:ABC transporter ATP-binding protein/permease [Oscillospiraceae bacterium]